MSDLEQILLFQIKALKLPVPETEYRFAPPRRWRFDLSWPEYMAAVEVEGGQWVQGRHNRSSGFEKDCEKYNEASLMGWRVIRVTGDMVNDGRAIAYVERLINLMRK